MANDERKIYEQVGGAMFFLSEYAYGPRNIEENMRPATKEEHQSTIDYIHKNQIKAITLTPLWLSTFNTDSATECFTAVQELKKRLEGEDD